MNLQEEISGGTRVALVQGPIGPEAYKAFSAAQTAAGAVASFAGIIRADKTAAAAVEGIEYSAYESMALAILKSMQQEILQQYELLDLMILHSLGMVRSEEHSMLVAVASRHRRAAFEALEETVERIKAEAPVWKKEHYTDGSHLWVGSNKTTP